MTHNRSDRRNVFNPTIHRSDQGKTILLTIPLTGIAEEKIRFDLENTTLTLYITTDEDVLKKSIRVPGGTRFFKKNFHDGILEIILEKPAS